MQLQLANLLIIILLLIGVIYCFFGYKILKFVVGIFGFYSGFLLGNFLVNELIIDNSIIRLIVSIIIGIFFTKLFLSVKQLGIFMLGAITGYLLCSIILVNLHNQIAVVITSSILSGIIAVIVHEFFIVFTTSIIGALIIGLCVKFFMFSDLTKMNIKYYIRSSHFDKLLELTTNYDDFTSMASFIVIISFFLGFVYQYSGTKNIIEEI
jgi:hypothetical protein